MSLSIWNPLRAVTDYIAGWFSYTSELHQQEDEEATEEATEEVTEEATDAEKRAKENAAYVRTSENCSQSSTSVSERCGQTKRPLTSPEKQKRCYGVALPKNTPLQGDDRAPFVFRSMKEVLQFCRRYHYEYPRWKLARDAAAAASFSLSAFDHDQDEQQKVDREALPFKSPTCQQLVQLRKLIESGQAEDVLRTIESNPRFLIGSGDTPTILQEGCRYNAFHVAAKAGQAEIMRIVFDKLRSSVYFKRLYPDDDERSTADRIAYIVDLYLNMPDKTRKGETPLHFASKYGSVQCVKFLLEQEACDRHATNCEGQTADDVACTRAGDETQKREIRQLFEQIFLIPIMRDYDGDGIPKLESPISVSSFQELYSPRRSSGKLISALIGPVSSPRAVEILSELKQTRYKPADVDLRNRDAEKGFETIARNTARRHGAPWREYWPFLKSSIDLASVEGRAKLNSYLSGRTYISGDAPTKSDYDVFSALSPVLDEILNDNSLLQLQAWLYLMRRFSRDEMKSWRTPNKKTPLKNTEAHNAADNDHCLVNLMERFNVAATQYG